jgi:hypothetical protein
MATSIEARPIKALHYGDALFDFFQDQYFSAITGLMVSQHFERLAPQGDEAEVLRGGLLLSYGMHNEAGAIFAALIDQGAAPSVRDRAWFYLAKSRYQRGFDAEAEAALARIQGPLPAALAEERGLLHAQLLMARADYAGAAGVLGAMTAGNADKASPYARFNLGVALIKSGDVAQGTAWLDKLGGAPADNEEQRSLRDRANLALGVAALSQRHADDARRLLERVRLNGVHANQALLGFGWAAVAQQQPALALTSWHELAARDAGDPAVLEALIALPFAHAALGDYSTSLEGYAQAAASFEAETQRLDASIAAIRSGRLIEGLLERHPGREMDGFGHLDELPGMPHAAHLSQVLARHEFQEAFRNVRDLHFLESNLRQWRDTLGVFRDMLENRRQAYASRLQPARALAQADAAALATLRERHAALATDVAHAELQADGVAYADAAQRGLLDRVARLRAALATRRGEPDIAALGERVRLTAGVLAWELAQAYPARRWTARKTMAEIERQLAQAGEREAALAQAQRDEPARFERFAASIDALARQLDATLPRVTALASEQQMAAAQIAAAALTSQQERLRGYAAQAHFEIAQLIDRGAAGLSHDRADH